MKHTDLESRFASAMKKGESPKSKALRHKALGQNSWNSSSNPDIRAKEKSQWRHIKKGLNK